MSNWKHINSTYIYDGTLEGLLTIAFNSYLNKEIPCSIISEESYIPNILDVPIRIKTDYEKSSRIFNGISKNISEIALYNIYTAFLSCNLNKEINILKYIITGFVIGPKITNMLSIDYVLIVEKLKRNVFGEAHRLKGLVRFMEITNNLFYASIHPDNNVIELVGKHFIRRFPSQNFILHDKNRNIAMLYNKNDYCIITVPPNFNLSISKNEKHFQNLWKTFFNTISIKERTNPRLQMQYMPKKYWKDLVELN